MTAKHLAVLFPGIWMSKQKKKRTVILRAFNFTVKGFLVILRDYILQCGPESAYDAFFFNSASRFLALFSWRLVECFCIPLTHFLSFLWKLCLLGVVMKSYTRPYSKAIQISLIQLFIQHELLVTYTIRQFPTLRFVITIRIVLHLYTYKSVSKDKSVNKSKGQVHVVLRVLSQSLWLSKSASFVAIARAHA